MRGGCELYMTAYKVQSARNEIDMPETSRSFAVTATQTTIFWTGTRT